MVGIACRIELLGELRIVYGDHVITRFRTQKAAGLIAYLAIHLRHAHARDAVADLFWPDKDLEAGRQNLTTTLTGLRRQLEAAGMPAQEVLLADRLRVRLHPDAIVTDVQLFDRALADAAHATCDEAKAAALESALALYRSPALPGRYEDWACDFQHRYAERHADALEQLCALLEALDRPDAALDAARRAVRADPYREAPRCVQMRAYAALGRVATGLESYRQYERLLRDEMGTAPSAAVQALAERLRRDPGAFEPRRAAGEGASPARPMSPRREGPAPATPATPAAPDDTAIPIPDSALPLQLTQFVGREKELARLTAMLQGPASAQPHRPAPVARLLTLTGPGGTGKTRLAIEVARRVEAAFEGRAWFVDLAALPGPDLVPMAIVNGMRLSVGRPLGDPLQAIADALRDRRSLLILDNFEHLLHRGPREPGKGSVAGGPEYVRLLLERTPGLACLVTSRQPLHLGGEQEFPVPPLATPGPEVDDPQRLSDSASVALYVDRASLVRPDFALTPANAGAVAELCRRLEGMPLAIEMAAAWARTLPPARVLERMERHLDMLVSRRRDLPARHQSLRATIEWSHDLLTPLQQQFLARLSVFRGGWTLEAAAEVCQHDLGATLALLSELQECSLVVAVETEDRVRYRLQETVREFAAGKLEERGERLEALRRHRDLFLDLAERSEALVSTTGRVDLLSRLDAERDNVRAAIQFCLVDPGSLNEALRFPIAMHHFWEARGHLAEGMRLTRALLDRPGAEAPTEARGYALQTCFWMAFYQGDYASGLPWIEEGLAIIRKEGSVVSLGNTLNAMGAACLVRKENARARACFEESLAIWQQLGDTTKIGRAKHNLARVLSESGDIEGARALFEECVALNRQTGNRGGVAATLHMISILDYQRGDLAAARRLGEEALALNREIGNRTWELFTLTNLAWVALAQGRTGDARAYCLEGLPLQQEVGSKKDLASCLECLAELAHAEGLWERAGVLWGAAEAWRLAIDRPGPYAGEATHAAHVAEASAALSDESFHRAWDAGAAMPVARLIPYALENEGA